MRPVDYARALLREREGYVLQRREHRVADVDAELDRLGVRPRETGAPETTNQAPPPEKATPPRPR